MPNPKYSKPAQNSLQCMAIKKGEKLLILTDQNKLAIAWALFDAALELEANVQLVRIPVAASHGSEPSEPLPEYMTKFDAIIAPTSKSISHTRARRQACEKGVRIITMPAIHDETFIRSMEANYREITVRSKAIARLFNGVNEVKVTSPSGTDIVFSIAGRTVHVDSGIIVQPGDFGNLPAGEVYIAPVEETANGIIALDGSMAGIGLLSKPLIITIENGYASQIKGEKADDLKSLLEPYGQDAKNLAEFAIGTNDKAQLCGSPLEDEKVSGTIHFALGDNITMGGNVAVPSHLDGIIMKPSVWFDGRQIMEDGKMIA
jgi:aminopeptidase